jgi:hypothetical protein
MVIASMNLQYIIDPIEAQACTVIKKVAARNLYDHILLKDPCLQ